MLYLEDYLEMIENLPMEMRDRFTEMREMDLEVQNAMDSLEDRVKGFFKKCGSTNNLKQEWKEEQMEKLKQEYRKALEDADEKVQLANQIYELVERYLRKLDQEVSKFKMELEADNAGITELLEKRSLDMDNPNHVNSHRSERRKHASSLANHLDKRGTSTEKVLSTLASEAARETVVQHRAGSTASSPATHMFNSGSPALAYSLGHVGAGSNAAIAAAASRAIGATLEMSQGRRTASLRASYEAVTRNTDLAKELSFTRDYSPAPSTTDTKPVRTKKATARAQQQQLQQQQQQQQQQLQSLLPVDVPSEDVPPDVVGEETTAQPWPVDPNEPRYCICNDYSYGDMVGCDNNDCPIEWFHYGCVGLTQAPKGKWYCPQCLAAMKRRGRK